MLMSAGAAAFEQVRRICLSFPDTSEADHFGDVCFRAGKKMFASCGSKDDRRVLVVQLESLHAATLVESDPRFQPYKLQKDCACWPRHWP